MSDRPTCTESWHRIREMHRGRDGYKPIVYQNECKQCRINRLYGERAKLQAENAELKKQIAALQGDQ